MIFHYIFIDQQPQIKLLHLMVVIVLCFMSVPNLQETLIGKQIKKTEKKTRSKQ